ncbi:hypothetical protein L202_05008 [Cryptococcus amylolentus CBS 6039]|uniref:CSC1/OSCA1-like 7TM region domain-containing protein n=1 Tax=Cryptococcus amylolentus CBS 6039 TaxID=1295533 RepID=A0A1E3HNK1_9TREE|nr:hypothetical protein L202_05008 [Cryptococcus amylolentus CBS 6039]ODN77902.1 hypothetical protein L202_05008 [Cryptococcus amylolentus CBS 6039]
MADLSQHTNYNAKYSGLLDNLWLTLAIAGVCLIGHELEVRVPRQRGTDGPRRLLVVRIYQALRGWKRRTSSRSHHPQQGDGRTSSEGLVEDKANRPSDRPKSREDWEFGYIYQPKVWAVNASQSLPKWPLAWIVASLKFKETDMPAKCGLDLTLHARFLRASFFYTLFHALIIMPILMPLHIFYSPIDVAKTSMLRASISSLVKSSGSKWLWVHALLIWWVSITWICVVLWITWGALAYRRREIRALGVKLEEEKAAARLKSRGEEGQDDIHPYADRPGLKRFRTIMVTNIPPDMRDEKVLKEYFDYYIQRHHARKADPQKRVPIGTIIKQVIPIGQNPSYSVDVEPSEGSDVEEIVLVRKLSRLQNLRNRRENVLRQLEIAHTKLAQRVLQEVTKYHRHPRKLHQIQDPVKLARMSILVEALKPYVNAKTTELDDTIWDILHSVPRECLDPFQELTHSPIIAPFYKNNAPKIDYLTLKLNYITDLIDEAQSTPVEDYPAASTAFATFKDAKTARLALKILDSHPKRTLSCRTTAAPEWTDLLWPRLYKSAYRSEFVRGWVVNLGVWAFTLVWIFPVSILCALASLTNIAGFVKPLQKFLDEHPKAASAITSLAPVIFVALLTLAICPLLLVIANKAETTVTRLGIHNSVLERFWKFLMVNGVVFFAIGQSTIEAYLTAFQAKSFDPLPIISSAFPTAAPYFSSYILLQVAIQPFFEIFRLGLPTIVYVFGTRHPTFSHFSQLPQHVLGGAIMHLFMLLNPLVIAFTLVYYGALYIVWKRQFVFVYGRLYETNGRRSSIRIQRYSTDALALAQFVLFAFFVLNKAKGHAAATGILFALTLSIKVVITRALKRRFDRLDHEEADLLCPPANNLISGNEQGGSDPYDRSDDEETFEERGKQEGDSKSTFQTVRRNFRYWTGGWIGKHQLPSERKPIPFDRTFFTALDSKVHLKERTDSNTALDDLSPKLTPLHETHGLALVSRHPPLPPWEDIPPYHRSRGYDDQPAYTDPYEEFLLLQRDPRSAIDLDDCVQVRLSLTTSSGGSGQISDWSVDLPKYDESEEENTVSPAASRPAPYRSKTEPLLSHVDSPGLSPEKEQHVWYDGIPGRAIRRHTDAPSPPRLSQLFRDPQTISESPGGDIMMRTFACSSAIPQTDSPATLGNDSERAAIHSGSATSLPEPILGNDNAPSTPQKERHINYRESTSDHVETLHTPSRSPSRVARSTTLLTPRVARSASYISGRHRTVSASSAQQQALLDEVMEEEIRESRGINKVEDQEDAKEMEEVSKELHRLNRKDTSSQKDLRRRRSRAATAVSLVSSRSGKRSGTTHH